MSIKTDNRRVDSISRTAIAALESLMYNPSGLPKAIEITLDAIAELSHSSIGVAYTSTDGKKLASFQSSGSLSETLLNESPNFVNSSVLLSWVSNKNLLSSSVFYNSPIPQATKSLLVNSAAIDSLMIIPIVINEQCYATFIFANASSNYSGALLTKIMPIIGALICVIRNILLLESQFDITHFSDSPTSYANTLANASPCAIVVVNESSLIIQSNKIAEDMFYPVSFGTFSSEGKSRLVGLSIQHFIPDFDSIFLWTNQVDKLGIKENETETESNALRRRQALRFDGSACEVYLRVFKHSMPKGQITTLQIQDITSLSKKAEEYKQISQQLNALTQLTPVAILRISSNWECTFANTKWSEFTGLEECESSARDWINGIHSNDINELLESLRNCMLTGQDLNQEVRLVSTMGTTKWVDFSSRIMFDNEGQVDGFLASCHDITERYITQEKMRHIAEYDALTGLANRMLFHDRLEQAFLRSMRDKTTISLFFLDLDGFKDINDSLGHTVGDLLLQKLAERLTNTLRKNDTVARFGGDEFVIMLGEDRGFAETNLVANKLIDSVSKPFLLEQEEVYVTISLGIARGHHNNSNPETLVKHADVALYAAKKAGKNRYEFFDSKLDRYSQARIALISELRTGIENNKFFINYQALKDSELDKVIGFEALLRFTDQQGCTVPPDRFIYLLEENNMILQVGKWVISETCRQLQAWESSGAFPKGGYLSFNVSSRQLLEPNFVSHIQACCHKYQIRPEQLVMEMTESVLISKPQAIKSVLEDLKSIGLRIALDDFGTGYSSLSYLQNFPFDIIKIDKSFIKNLSDDHSNTKIVKAIIALASSLGMLVVAEGIESKNIVKQLQRLDVDIYQGYYISKPVAPDEAILLV